MGCWGNRKCLRALVGKLSLYKSRQAGVRSFLTGDGQMRGESHDFLLLVFLDRLDRRADFGFVWSGTLVETAKSLSSEFIWSRGCEGG